MKIIGLLGLSAELICKYSGIKIPVFSHEDLKKSKTLYENVPFGFVEFKEINDARKSNGEKIDYLIAKKDLIHLKSGKIIDSDVVIIRDIANLEIAGFIGINSGDYSIADFKSSDNFFRYIVKMRNEKGIFIFRKMLSNDEILHFLVSVFLTAELL
ncbi:hypothetical protein JYK00_05135 [Thermosipho ferrireducens]|uniref:Uncharacterized protein n=1 Tax=Thermosipho ferrireducens TaxID=2571116 RepID=A0ABX7S403_9BACT|nr:hypothetical protein [Thermosipho ferrireducens]QTA37138.1 hypothetical protein JYK00_05135 [Thermosipho ferrireducens]